MQRSLPGNLTAPAPTPLPALPDDTRPPIEALAEQITAATRVMARTITAHVRAARVWLRRVDDHLRRIANDPVRVAGLEARYAVRAGLDPAYTTLPALDGLVVAILHGDDPDLFLVSRENRAVIAAAAMGGWARSYDGDVTLMPWHRFIDGRVLQVVPS